MNIRTKVSLGYECFKSITCGIRRPIFVSWQITDRCNLSCGYCLSSGNKAEEMDAGRALGVIDSLRCMGTRFIRFTGGEPLLRDDLSTLIARCRELGVYVGLASNGILFPERVRDLGSVSVVSFSLDGPESIHDAVRGVGAYQAVIRAIEAARINNVHVTISCTINKLNINSIDYILKLAQDWRIKVFFQPATLMKLHRGEINQFAPDPSSLREAVGILIGKKSSCKYIGNSRAALRHMIHWPNKTAIHCVAGKIICRINADGQMYACPRFKGGSAGYNLKVNDVRQCFHSLVSPSCGECWCGLFVELNLLSELNWGVLADTFWG